MVKLDVVRSCNAALVKSQPLVAVFVGGTSGIGAFTILALAATHSDQGRGLRLYIVGRNDAAAEKTIAECIRLCPKGQFRFVKAQDLSLLKDVDLVCAEIIRIEESEHEDGRPARVDLLVMSQAYFPLSFEPRAETKEGLDTNMSLLYYSRMRFIVKLLPLLLASRLPAHVVSVYAAGLEGKLFPEDLSLRDPKLYGLVNVRSHVTYMTTTFMETMAERYRARLSLVHIFPSLVVTEGFDDARLPTWFKIAWRLSSPFAKLFSTAGSEIGERVLFLATPRFPARQVSDSAQIGEVTNIEGDAGVATGTDGERGSGAYAVDFKGDTISTDKAYKRVRDEKLGDKFWDHTMKAFEEFEAGRAFTA